MTRLAAVPLSASKKRRAVLKRIIRAVTFPIDHMLPKSKLQAMKKILAKDDGKQ